MHPTIPRSRRSVPKPAGPASRGDVKLRLGALAIAVCMIGAGCAANEGRAPAAGTQETASPSATSSAPVPSPTATTPVEPVPFAVIGDFGSSTAAERAIAGRMCRWREKRSFEVVVTTGDNVYPDGSPERFEDAFFEPFECLLADGVTFRSSLGNHDVLTDNGRPELREEAFGFDGRNYVVRMDGVRIVVADSNALDRAWLEEALVSEPGDRWTVVVFHHPVFSPGTGHGSTPGFRPGLPRMFRRAGVDLVLNGHDHVYAVTRPLRGIRYVVTGGGGAYLYGCREAWFAELCVPRHHFLYVVARAERIWLRAVPMIGRPFDRLSTSGRS